MANRQIFQLNPNSSPAQNFFIPMQDSVGAQEAVKVTIAQLKAALNLTKADVGLSNVDNTSDLNKPISTATQNALNLKADLVAGKIPSSQLPSFVDDVLEYNNLAAFPATGETGKMYVALDTNLVYRWSGSAYIKIADGAVTSVAGKTGVVTLTSADVGLENVPNVNATNPANISQSASYRFVTDSEKSTWNGKENAIVAGTTTQYWRGDKTWQTLNIGAIIGFPSQTGQGGKYLTTDGSVLSWGTLPGGGLANAYVNISDGTTTASASGSDTIRYRSANNAITVNVYSNDATFGDNVLLTFNQSNITITQSQVTNLTSDLNGKQNQLNGNGFVKANGTTITYDNSTYITGNQTITLSGDVSGTGATSISTSIAATTVTGKVLTNYVVGTNSAITAADTILASFGKIQAQLNAKEATLAAGTTSQYYRGDKTWQTLNTAAVPESSSLYFTEGRVRSTVLTGYVVGTNTAIANTDTVLGSIQKIQGQLNAKAPLESPTFSGSPIAPTAAVGTNSTQIATTAFVKTAIDATDIYFDEVTIIGTGTQVDSMKVQTTALADFTSTTKGVVPASGGGTTNFLRADGTWTAPSGGVPGGTSGQFQYNNAGVFAGVSNLTFTSSLFQFAKPIEVNTTRTSQYTLASRFYVNDMLANDYVEFILGKTESGMNRFAMAYQHSADGSSDNNVSFFFNGTPVLFRIKGSGEAYFKGVDDASATDKYIGVNNGTLKLMPTPVGAGSPSVVKTSKSTLQNIGTVDDTAITFDLESFDSDGYFEVSASASRFTVPSGKAGYYRVEGYISMSNSTNSNEIRMVKIKKNGTEVIAMSSSRNTGSTTTPPTIVSASGLVYLNVADYVELFGHHSVTAGDTVAVDGIHAAFSMSLIK